MRLTLHVWRQRNGRAEGQFVKYDMPNASEDMSFLEMLDGCLTRS
jgi:succinate dehydrogenase / fumarate reductase iron-sulfur subunit